ncbi:MAG: hypothetical protein HY513_05545 [Candidatus Aenigmarchaeota archaeon]|nr:hypothetical protein [Candidatus Aenigmarchaeota archaeon]
MELAKFSKHNILSITILIFSTVFALWQHSTGYSWDFSGYTVNARPDGAIFEWARPPLASAIMFILGNGSLASEYLYIIFVSLFYFYSSFVLSRKYSIDFTHYYVFAMSFFTIINAFNVGTELLSLALLQLMIAYICMTPKGVGSLNNKHETKNSILSGVFFGLSLLARYTNLAFVILFIFQKNIKKILLSLIITLLVLTPWLAFNYAYTGDPLLSIAESYALNIKYRTAIQQFNALDVLLVMNFVLPFFVLGIIKFRSQLLKNKEKLLMIVLFVIAIIFYIRTPLKEPRYMLAAIIPGAYFASLFLGQYKKYIYLIAAVNVVVVMLLLPTTQLGSPSPYLNFIANEKWLTDAESVNHSCSIRSNAWVALGYYGVPSDAYPWQDALPSALEEGYTVVLFKYNPEPLYLHNRSFVDKYKTVETPQYVILDNPANCKPAEKRIDVSYFKIRGEGMFYENGTILDKRSCAVFISPSFCDAIGWEKQADQKALYNNP